MQQAEIDDSQPVFVGKEAHWLRAEVMRRLNRDRTTLYRWAKAGKLTRRTYFGRVCYPVGEVLQLQAANDKKERSDG